MAAGIPLWVTKEETDGAVGNLVRDSIANKMDPLATTFLFIADRADHVSEIASRLAAGTHVLCDRYLHSTLAYQGVTLGDRIENVQEWLRSLHTPWAPIPDHVLLFDAPAETCVARTKQRGETTPYEKISFLAKVRASYLQLADGDVTVTTVDSQGPIEDVQNEALARVKSWLSAPL